MEALTTLQVAAGPYYVWQNAADSDIIPISPWAVATAAALILVQATVSLRLGLAMGWQLGIAAVRCVVQLSILGYILVPIFQRNEAWMVLSYAMFMLSVATVEAVARPAYTYKGMFTTTLGIITGCSSATMMYGMLLVLRVHPWWEAQYVIPILGMVLGNVISGISIGLATMLEELASGRDRIEKLLALGATRYEASREAVRRSVRVAMTPLLNTMSVVGLVSIPGMMTGQILSGADPSQAARYQMVIMFLLGATSTMGSVLAVQAAVLHIIDACHRMRPERLISRGGRGKGVGGAISAVSAALLRLPAAAASCLCGRCAPRRHQKAPANADASASRVTATLSSGSGSIAVAPGDVESPGVGSSNLRQPLLPPQPVVSN